MQCIYASVLHIAVGMRWIESIKNESNVMEKLPLRSNRETEPVYVMERVWKLSTSYLHVMENLQLIGKMHETNIKAQSHIMVTQKRTFKVLQPLIIK